MDFSSVIDAAASKYADDVIIVLGKGPSVDGIDQAVFKDRLVIGLNDAERIAHCDLTMLREDWAVRSIADNDYSSDTYLVPTELEGALDSTMKSSTVALPRGVGSNDGADEVMRRVMDSADVAIEEALILTSLEVCTAVARSKGRRQTVYMLGFDFDPALGYSRAASSSFAPAHSQSRDASVRAQEHILRHAMYMLQDSPIKIVHVGSHTLSGLSVGGANAALAGQNSAVMVRQSSNVKITAELTTNHFGDRGRLERMIREAHAAGADFVKLQKRDVETFYTKEQLDSQYHSPFGETFGDYRRALELDASDFAFVDELCKSLGIEWFASVLDKASFEFMVEIGATLIKLPSTISEHREYLEYVARNYSGSLVLSTGMTDSTYEDWVLDHFGANERLYLLHCNSAYPTPDEDCNVAVVSHYAALTEQYPNLVPGYSSHDHGWMGSALAVAAGARMVEKHVKLGNTEWAHFDAVAVDMTTDAFREYVNQIRLAEVMLGSGEKRISPSEHHKYVPVAAED